MSKNFPTEVLVLGIGNILWADEGFGVRAVEAFHQRFKAIDGVRVMDGGTLGNYLINDVTDSRRILLFDCCDLKAEAGTLRVLRDDDIKLWSSTKISPHQTGMNDVLVTAALGGYEPEALTVIGVQPKELNDYGGSLTEVVKAKVNQAVDLAREELKTWGFELNERDADEVVEPLGFSSLELDPYETERPKETDACRVGDIRFLKTGDKSCA